MIISLLYDMMRYTIVTYSLLQPIICLTLSLLYVCVYDIIVLIFVCIYI